MGSNNLDVFSLPEPSVSDCRVDGYLQEYLSMEHYQRGEGEGRTKEISGHTKINLFVEKLVDLCREHGMEMNGCFSIGISLGPDDEDNSLRNFEHVSGSGVIRTTSRGNRL
jgi:hypothetical protein